MKENLYIKICLTLIVLIFGGFLHLYYGSSHNLHLIQRAVNNRKDWRCDYGNATQIEEKASNKGGRSPDLVIGGEQEGTGLHLYCLRRK